MKTLYLVGGTMGVGKTASCRLLAARLPNSVFLDGDWCWDMHPFQVTEETKAMVMDNITHLLGNFLACPAFENIVFCWVLHEDCIRHDLLSRLDVSGCRVKNVSLTASPEALCRRLQGDVDAGRRTPDIIDRSLARLPLYDMLDTLRLDTSELSPEETARRLELL